MKIIDKYIIKETLRLIFPIWLTLSLLLYVLEVLAQVFNIEASVLDILITYAYKIPNHSVLIFPVATLFSFLAVLGNMNRKLELVAIQSFGFSFFHVIKASFLSLILASVPFYFVNNYLSPVMMERHLESLGDIKNEKRSLVSRVRKSKVWYRNKDILYNINYYDTEEKVIYGLTLYLFDGDFHLAQTIFAKSAFYDEKNSEWILKEGYKSFWDKNIAVPQSEAFQELRSALIEKPSLLLRVIFNPLTMTQPDLEKSIKQHKNLGVNTKEREVIFHSRYSFLAIPFVFLLIAFPQVTRFSRHSSLARDGTFVVFLSMGYWFLYTYSMSLGNKGKLDPLLSAWAPTLAYLLFIFFHYLLKKNSLRLSA